MNAIKSSSTDEPAPGYCLLTRWRWNWYFLPTIALFTAVGIVESAVFDMENGWVAPLLPLIGWLCMRYTTPKSGLRAERISAIPGMIPMLLLGALSIVLVYGTMIAEIVISGRRTNELELRDLLLYTPSVIIFFCGLWWIQKRYPALNRKKHINEPR